MKITYFRLKGYIKVLNGMGLDEISIPFSEFKNRIILIQGENGCSKSTIIEALSPNPDSNDSYRTDVFIDSFGQRQIIEYPAEKEIHYTDIDETGFTNTYKILIQSLVDNTKTRRTTKAFIYKNGENLNPNGNVSSFKEIRDSLLGIDPIYLDLSSVSAENRGIVDMIPSERRKYMASYIGSLDTYNNIFKNLSKKVTGLKSYINTLNSKIYELGNENELRLRLSSLETSLSNANKERDNLMKALAEAEATVRLVDPDNKMQDLYSSISERLEKLNSEIEKNQRDLEQVYIECNIPLENVDFITLRQETSTKLEEYRSSASEKKSVISTLISLNESTTSKLESDRNILSGLATNNIPDNIEFAVEELEKQKSQYSQYLNSEDIKFFKSITIDELSDLRDSLQQFLQEVSVAEDMYSADEFDESVESVMNVEKGNVLKERYTKSQKEVIDSKARANSLSIEIEKLMKDIDELEKFDSDRPKSCKIDTCPFISRFMEMKSSGVSKQRLVELREELFNLNISIANTESWLESYNHIEEINSHLNIAFSILFAKKSIIRKIKPLSYLVDNIGLVKEKVKSLYRFPDFNVVDTLIEKYSIYLDYQKIEQQLKDLEGDLKIYRNNKSLVESLNKSITDNEKELADRTTEMTTLNREVSFLSNLIKELESKLIILDKIISLLETKSSLEKEKDDLRTEFNSVKDKIKLVKDKMNSVNDIKNDISIVEESMKPIKDSISQTQYALSNIIAYQSEYKEYSDQYDKMVFIRNACSPGNGMGIQSEYIKRYMNDIIIDCNQMLGFMFGGSIQLDIPNITEHNFSIPFLGPNGLIVPDISNGSTAQKCMIGLVFSCVAMMKSSLKYNIPRFDEIDGGLDQQNRITFINVLNQILDFMRSEQCIICSHNTEFDTQNTTRLLCSHSGIRIEQ